MTNTVVSFLAAAPGRFVGFLQLPRAEQAKYMRHLWELTKKEAHHYWVRFSPKTMVWRRPTPYLHNLCCLCASVSCERRKETLRCMPGASSVSITSGGETHGTATATACQPPVCLMDRCSAEPCRQRNDEPRASAKAQAGIKLLWTDIRIASRLIGKAASGKTLSRFAPASGQDFAVHEPLCTQAELRRAPSQPHVRKLWAQGDDFRRRCVRQPGCHLAFDPITRSV